jgi:hypothetical protein
MDYIGQKTHKYEKQLNTQCLYRINKHNNTYSPTQTIRTTNYPTWQNVRKFTNVKIVVLNNITSIKSRPNQGRGSLHDKGVGARWVALGGRNQEARNAWGDYKLRRRDH